jgi:aspartyl/asparaginyl beta-hydroxylase (cupin superfamily)
VGRETKHWREGEMLILDGTVTHEAWNHGSDHRIVLLPVLLFAFARPGCENAPQDKLLDPRHARWRSASG